MASNQNVYKHNQLAASNYLNKWYVDDIYIKDLPKISYTDFNEEVESQVNLMVPEEIWKKTTNSSHSSTHSWVFHPSIIYGFNANMSLTSCVIDMRGSQNPILEFWHRFNFHNADFNIEVSRDNGTTWNVIKSYYGGNTNWANDVIYLREYKTDQIRVRFRVFSWWDSDIYDGWYIDDIHFKELTEITYTTFHEDAESLIPLMNPTGLWGKTTEFSHSPTNSWTDSPYMDSLKNNETCLTSCLINLNGSQHPVLEYWYRKNIAAYNFGYVEVSADYGKTWAIVRYLPESSVWQCDSINLESYKTNTVLIRFRYSTNSDTAPNAGLYIDDLRIIDSN